MEFGKKFRILRESCGHTQKEIATMMNVTEASIQNYESSRSTPTFAFLHKIYNKFPQYAVWLMTDIDDVGRVSNQSPITTKIG